MWTTGAPPLSGAPLPDLLQLALAPEAEQELLMLSPRRTRQQELGKVANLAHTAEGERARRADRRQRSMRSEGTRRHLARLRAFLQLCDHAIPVAAHLGRSHAMDGCFAINTLDGRHSAVEARNLEKRTSDGDRLM